jgi:probable F420-dependent oxidoreductase
MAETILGAVFPQNEIPPNRPAVEATVLGVENLGLRHLVVYDHVVGADPDRHPEGPGLRPTNVGGGTEWAYTDADPFHEPMVLFGFIAALTRLEMVTGILILPQRQTVLVAKQAAAIDVLSAGRLRLGVGIGWNAVEYQALGQDFADRGPRLEEQVALLRRLWTEPVVDFGGRWHTVHGAGVLPLPVQRPIPIWMGTRAHGPALRRVGRLADGWITMERPGPDLDRALDTIRTAAAAAGRDPDSIGLEGRIDWRDGDIGRIRTEHDEWCRRGANHIALSTLGAGFREVEQHLDALATMTEALGGAQRV